MQVARRELVRATTAEGQARRTPGHGTHDLAEHAVATSKWDEAKGSAGTPGQSCASCHGVYGERLEDRACRITLK